MLSGLSLIVIPIIPDIREAFLALDSKDRVMMSGLVAFAVGGFILGGSQMT